MTVRLVCGPPGAGKSTLVREKRRDGDLVIDLAAHEARVSGAAVALTRTEFNLLATLSAGPGRAYSRRQLIDIVWDPSWVGDERIVDVHIGHLRRKLGEDPIGFIDTVRGVGYRMVAP